MFRLALSLIGVIVTVGLIWLSNVPLGVPGEWTWPRIPLSADFPWNVVPGCIWVGLLGSYVWFGSQYLAKFKDCDFWRTAAWLGGLLVLSFLTLGGMRELAPLEYRSAKIAFVLYFPGSSGYFTEARQIENAGEFLARYETVVNQGDVLHQGTHPPGLILGYRGLMWLSQWTWLQNAVLQTVPRDLEDAFRVISQQSQSTGGPALTRQDRCVLWMAALLMQTFAAATVVPLYMLLRLGAGRLASWQLVSFWPMVPAVTLFLPKSDACFPFIGCAFLALWLHGLKRRSWLLCGLAGFVLWMGMFLSLALLPVAFLAGMLSFWYVFGCRAQERWNDPVRRLGIGCLAGVFGFVVPIGLLWGAAECNLFVIWIQNLQNHAGFYQHYPRTYWKWLLANPLELGLAQGLPITLLGLTAAWESMRRSRHANSGPVWCCLFTWGLLWISGKNMGEAARLWIFLMPWCLWGSGVDWHEQNERADFRESRRTWAWHWSCQALAAIATISHVVGFQL